MASALPGGCLCSSTLPQTPGEAVPSSTASISLWTVVAAVQAVEKSVEAHASRLLNLERRTVTTEKKYLDCEKTVVDFGNQLESKLTVLGTLIREYGQLQRRLEHMENLLKNRNFWVLRLPPGLKAPEASEGDAACFTEQEWENLEEWQKELYKNMLRGNSESLSSLADYAIPEPSFAGALKQNEEVCVEEQEATEGAEFTELSVVPADEVIAFKIEQLDSDECLQSSECPTALSGESEDMVFQSANEALPFDSQYSSPVPLGNQSMSRLVPSASGEGDLGEISTVTFYRQDYPEERPHPCIACGKGLCLKKMLMMQQNHSTLCGTEPGEDENIYIHQPHQQIHVATETFKQNQKLWSPSPFPPGSVGYVCFLILELGFHLHEENRRDPLAGSFVSMMSDSDLLERPEEKFHEGPSPTVTWDSQWSSEMMETTPSRNGFGGEAQYDRAFAEHLDLFSAQQNDVRRKLCSSSRCEGSSTQREHLPALQGLQTELLPVPKCENSPTKAACQHPVDAAGEKLEGLPATSGPSAAGGIRLREHNGLCREDRPLWGSGGKLPAENLLSSPCEADPWAVSEAPRGGVVAQQQQSQGRGKSYICNDCGKSFVCHSWLVRHQTSHTGERPYKCSECDKSYRRKDYLLKHLRRHSGEGLFPCRLCTKRFVLRRSLIKHQESHAQRTHQTVAGWPRAEIRESVLHSR
ncbi:UNVERIFIED_CONTAM: hypothetical protein H355_002163 [Colinus virginianus]|nr:hypothetical protein H355_002163 [Colinus virginianus]